ncbi:hypothetical protein E4U43_002261 [Claviceps pusilla]|uniref:Uncharacterized protein n=1 Tax=Claviceps pusilla TaxID=123648 RepID=A0A9P7N8X1_9HYPO|nr:hypothetical protein E4U43_002261 [Claviceps pusilla]
MESKEEANLSDHDVEFQFSSVECNGAFYLLLMCSGRAQRGDEKKRIDNLAGQACAKKGVVLLLQGEDGMSSWMELQMYRAKHGQQPGRGGSPFPTTTHVESIPSQGWNLAPSLEIRDGHNADPDGKIIVSRAVGEAHQLLHHSLPRPFIAR